LEATAAASRSRSAPAAS